MSPLVPAWLSVWQAPHFWTNSSLPRTMFAVGCLSVHPPNATITSAAAESAAKLRTVGARAFTIAERGTLSERSASRRHLLPGPARWPPGYRDPAAEGPFDWCGIPRSGALLRRPLVAWQHMRTRQKYRMRTP